MDLPPAELRHVWDILGNDDALNAVLGKTIINLLLLEKKEISVIYSPLPNYCLMISLIGSRGRRKSHDCQTRFASPQIDSA